MDKIDFSAVTTLNSALHPNLKGEAKKTKKQEEPRGSRKLTFTELMEESAAAPGLGPITKLPPSDEALESLMDAVHSAGNDLRERPFTDEIIRYKKTVRDFINYVLENGYETGKVQGLKTKFKIRGETRWKENVYHQVRVIDRKLEELAAAILSGQTAQLTIVSKLDEIKGLLVDLTLSGAIKE